MLFGMQIRGARGLLKMSQAELSDLTGISVQTIVRLESDEEAVKKASYDTLVKIKNTLKQKGIKFLPPQSDQGLNGVGVRLFLEKDNAE